MSNLPSPKWSLRIYTSHHYRLPVRIEKHDGEMRVLSRNDAVFSPNSKKKTWQKTKISTKSFALHYYYYCYLKIQPFTEKISENKHESCWHVQLFFCQFPRLIRFCVQTLKMPLYVYRFKQFQWNSQEIVNVRMNFLSFLCQF